MIGAEETVRRHSLYEDALALVMGPLLVSLGLALYTKATLGTGGTAGLALLLHYASGLGFGVVFFVLNLPFYVLAVRRMGWPFAIRTFVAVAVVSALSLLTPRWIVIADLQPIYAAVAGGALIGVGMLVLFRHRAGLGGFNVLAVYLQDRGIMRAGYFQLLVDSIILIAALFVIPWDKVLLSLLGAAVMNLTLAINHRRGRYLGVS